MHEIRKQRREEEQELARQEEIDNENLGEQSESEILGGMGARAYQETTEMKKFKNKIFQVPLVFNFDFDRPGLEKPWA